MRRLRQTRHIPGSYFVHYPQEDLFDVNAPSGLGSPAEFADRGDGIDGTEGRPSQPDATPVILNDVIASWDSGNKDGALAQLLLIKWDDTTAFRDIEAFAISERQLRSLPEDQREPIMQQAMGVARSGLALAKHTLATAEALAASGDVEMASVGCKAVLQCGQRWQSLEFLEVIQSVGKSMATLAKNKLSALR